jgi:hypothetical protein
VYAEQFVPEPLVAAGVHTPPLLPPPPLLPLLLLLPPLLFPLPFEELHPSAASEPARIEMAIHVLVTTCFSFPGSGGLEARGHWAAQTRRRLS